MIVLLLLLLAVPAWASEITGAKSYANVTCPDTSGIPEAQAYCKERALEIEPGGEVRWRYQIQCINDKCKSTPDPCLAKMDAAMKAVKPWLLFLGIGGVVTNPTDRHDLRAALTLWGEAEAQCWREP